MVSEHAPHTSYIFVHKDLRITKCTSKALPYTVKIKRGEGNSFLYQGGLSKGEEEVKG